LTCLVAASMMAGCPNVDLASRRNSAPEAAPVRSDSGRAATRSKLEPGALKTVPSAPVQGWRGPADQPFDVALRTPEREPGHARRFGSVTLQTALRARPLGQYPCTSCHLGRKLVMTVERVADAHEDIQPVHPKQTGSRCSTCHASEDVEQLRLESGARASLDQSYQLCSQCHFSEADAWAHGGHGKRLDGWQGRRVVMGCTDCHDPHRPALQPRIPFRAPQIERPKGPNP
jgi:hypothetical protein